jgi:hypothetical protein
MYGHRDRCHAAMPGCLGFTGMDKIEQALTDLRSILAAYRLTLYVADIDEALAHYSAGNQSQFREDPVE